MSNHSRIKIVFTPEQLEIIKNKYLSIREISEKLGVSHSLIQKKRDKLKIVSELPKRSNSRKIIFTPEQMEFIKDTSLSSRAVENKIKIGQAVIARKRKELGIKTVGKRSHSRVKKEITEEMLIHIKDVSKAAHTVSVIIGISQSLIRNKRQELGLNAYKPLKKGIKRGEYKKPIKEKLPTLKLVKTSHGRETEFEQENRLKRNAEKAKLSYKEIEDKKIQDGYRWRTIIGERGIKETKLIKV